MNILSDNDNWKNLEKIFPNLIYNFIPRTKINVCGHVYEIYTGQSVNQ